MTTLATTQVRISDVQNNSQMAAIGVALYYVVYTFFFGYWFR